ncbi:hypothetical protein HKCCE3408_03780 [Rhodobacterales bacterium HKCCE3408]|nr:hypothetical protein [Rhodobacterales bacterium HKCCE3408]
MSFIDDLVDHRPDFEQAFERVLARALIVNAHGLVLVANARARDMMPDGHGSTPEVGPHVADVFMGEPAALMSDIVAVASGGKIPLRPRKSADSEARLSFRVLPLIAGRRRRQYLLYEDAGATLTDAMAGLRREHVEALRSAAQERRLRREMERSVESMRAFSSSAAHDLKAPLRNIASLLSFLEEDFGGDLPEGARSYVETSKNAAERLQGLIDDLMDHARSGTSAMALVNVGLRPLIAEIRADLCAEIAAAGGRIEIAGDVGEVLADRTLLRQLLQNLIGNAVKYRHPDRAPVLMIARDGSVLTLSDNGRGFDPANAHLLFEPFRRLHADSGVEGSGIGLSACKIICDRHGWTIEATAREGEGATFAISGLSTPAD